MKKAMDLKKSDPTLGAEVTPTMMDLMTKLEQVPCIHQIVSYRNKTLILLLCTR